ncbi:hypothetical protein [Streptosporangium oxazolinicum]
MTPPPEWAWRRRVARRRSPAEKTATRACRQARPYLPPRGRRG